MVAFSMVINSSVYTPEYQAREFPSQVLYPAASAGGHGKEIHLAFHVIPLLAATESITIS